MIGFFDAKNQSIIRSTTKYSIALYVDTFIMHNYGLREFNRKVDARLNEDVPKKYEKGFRTSLRGEFPNSQLPFSVLPNMLLLG